MSDDECEVLGAIISTCKMMDKRIESVDGHRRGINQWNYINLNSGDATRTVVGIVTKGEKSGVAFNFCPFCGVEYPYSESLE